jgi:hypothetical protein
MKEKILLVSLLLLLTSVCAQTQDEKSYVLDLKYTLKTDSFELLNIELANSGSPNYVLDSADYYFEYNNAQDKEKFFFMVPNVIYSEPDSDINMFDDYGNQIYFPDEADIVTKEEVTEFSIVLPYSETGNKLSIKDKTGKEKLTIDLAELKKTAQTAEIKKQEEDKGTKETASNYGQYIPILVILTIIVAIIFLREWKNEKEKN